jgi:membrane protein implicated in regulation of membrane protease activity
MSFLPPLSAFSVFLAIASVGFLFLLVSLVFGEIFDHFDSSFDHDLGHGGPGFFSSRVVSVFITAFGCVGAISMHYGLGPLPSSLLGFVSGLVFGGGVYAFARFLYNQQASSDVLSKDLVGQSARVVVTIPSGGVGQIRCRVGEELIDKVARARDGSTIPEHTTVRVDEVLGEVVIVSKH